MEADLPSAPTSNLAEERKNITPDDPDPTFDSEDSSLGIDSSNEDDEESYNLVQETSEKPEREEGKEEKNEEPTKQINQSEGRQETKVETIKRSPNFEERDSSKDFLPFVHNVDTKFKTLLRIMISGRKVNLNSIADLAKNEGFVELPPKGPTVIVRTYSKQIADQAINKLSDFIDNLNILKLDLRPEFASKLQKFKGLKFQIFKKLGIFIFGEDSVKGTRELYIGGIAKVSDLRKIQQEIRSYKIINFGLKRFQNKRSYKLILSNILKSQLTLGELHKFNKVNLVEIDKHSRELTLRYFMNTTSKLEVSAVEYEHFIYQIVRKFFAITFTLRKQNYYPKPEVAGHPQIQFSIVKDYNVPLAYLYIICPTDTFFEFSQEILAEISKLGEWIVGMRFFNYLQPNFRWFQFDSDIYIVKKFPSANTYSMCVRAKTREGKQFDWKEVFNFILTLKDKYEEQGPLEEDSLELDD